MFVVKHSGTSVPSHTHTKSRFSKGYQQGLKDTHMNTHTHTNMKHSILMYACECIHTHTHTPRVTLLTKVDPVPSRLKDVVDDLQIINHIVGCVYEETTSQAVPRIWGGGGGGGCGMEGWRRIGALRWPYIMEHFASTDKLWTIL